MWENFLIAYSGEIMEKKNCRGLCTGLLAVWPVFFQHLHCQTSRSLSGHGLSISNSWEPHCRNWFRGALTPGSGQPQLERSYLASIYTARQRHLFGLWQISQSTLVISSQFWERLYNDLLGPLKGHNVCSCSNEPQGGLYPPHLPSPAQMEMRM